MGKTTLLERAVAALQKRGLSVLAVKSSHHSVADQQGSDSARLSLAGSAGTVLLAANGSHLYLDPPLRLEELLPLLASRYQVGLVEGGKGSVYPKVELISGQEALLPEEQVVARLERGAKDCPRALEQLLELWDSKGQQLSAAKI